MGKKKENPIDDQGYSGQSCRQPISGPSGRLVTGYNLINMSFGISDWRYVMDPTITMQLTGSHKKMIPLITQQQEQHITTWSVRTRTYVCNNTKQCYLNVTPGEWCSCATNMCRLYFWLSVSLLYVCPKLYGLISDLIWSTFLRIMEFFCKHNIQYIHKHNIWVLYHHTTLSHCNTTHFLRYYKN